MVFLQKQLIDYAVLFIGDAFYVQRITGNVLIIYFNKKKKNNHNVSDEEIEALFTKLKNEGIILEEIEIIKKKIE